MPDITELEQELSRQLGVRRGWRRMERRAVRSHELMLLKLLRNWSADCAELWFTGRRAGGELLPALRWVTADHELVLAGVGLYLPASAAGSPFHLVGAGRYGRGWWLSLSNAGAAVTVLGSHLVVLPRESGGRGRPGPGVPVDLSRGLVPA
jgi:hypothetical protein